jgi:hypothetical protein
MPIQSYRDLIVWQRAMDLLTECYRVARLLPPSETYALGAHLERAAVAVAAHEVGRMLTALRRSLGAPHLQPGAASLAANAPAGGVSAGPLLVDSRPRSP